MGKLSYLPVSVISISFVAVLFSCNEEEPPTLRTLPVTEIRAISAMSGGYIFSDEGAFVTEKGLCWDTEKNPDINRDKINNGSGTANFSGILADLIPAKTYYVRAYAINDAGTGFGNEISFITEPYDLAVLTTNQVVAKNENIALSGGNILYDGEGNITERGVCWSKSSFPSISDQHTVDGNGPGGYTSEIRCMDDGTDYYVRAYVTNEAGTSYGNQVLFTTPDDQINFNPALSYGMVSDIEGNCYRTIQIGDEIWMAENLRTSRYNDGTPILKVTDNVEWGSLLSDIYTGPYVYHYRSILLV